MKQFNGRAIGFAGVDPNVGEQAVKDLEYAVNELGFKGMKINPSIYEISAMGYI